jgi:adenylate cyclase class 1
MTIIGKKLSTCIEKKQNKIPVVHKPLSNLNRPTLTFGIKNEIWHVFASGDSTKPVISNPDIVYCTAYLIWNDIYQAWNIRMIPNPTPVTLQEITNLATRVQEIFGTFNVTKVAFENFLEAEKATKMLVVINFEGSHHAKDLNDFCVIYSNHWGELFVQRFNSPYKLKKFIESDGRKFSRTEMHYYVQRNSLYYEKIIERTKNLVTQILSSVVETLVT